MSAKVLHVITDLTVGGAQASLRMLLREMDSPQDHAVLSLKGPTSNRVEVDELADDVVYAGLDSLRDIRRLRTVSDVVRTWQPDIIHSWMYHACVATELARGRVPKVPSIWGIRNVLGAQRRLSPIHAISRMLAAASPHRPDLIVYCGRRVAEAHESMGFDQSKSRVILNGIDLPPGHAPSRAEARAELGLPADALVIGTVGRFAATKDYPNLFRCMSDTRIDVLKPHWLLVGEGLEPSNRSLPELVGVSADRLHLAGRQADVRRYLAAMDIFVLSSSAEGIPNALLEAMAEGKPCVVTDVGDCAEALGGAGLLVPPGDSRALASALYGYGMLSDAARETLGRRAQTSVRERFSRSAMARGYTTAYDEILGAASS